MVEIEARDAGRAGELGSAARLRERRTGARQVPYGRGDVPARLLANLSRRSCGALPGLAPPWSEARGRRPLSAATPGLLSDRGEAIGQPGEDQSPRDWAPSAKTPAAKPRGQPLPPPCCQHNPSHLKVTPNSDQSSNQPHPCRLSVLGRVICGFSLKLAVITCASGSGLSTLRLDISSVLFLPPFPCSLRLHLK